MTEYEQRKAPLERSDLDLNKAQSDDSSYLLNWLEEPKWEDDKSSFSIEEIEREHSSPLLANRGWQLFDSNSVEADNQDEVSPEQIRAEIDAAYAAADSWLQRGNLPSAIEALNSVIHMLDALSISDDYVWTDFKSPLDEMLFKEYYQEEIDGRPVKRHPLQPAARLHIYGNMLLGMRHPEEALEALTRLLALDPICPDYLFDLCKAYENTKNYQKSYDTALWALECVSTPEQMATCYRHMAYCLKKSEEYRYAAALYRMSLKFQHSGQAETELSKLQKMRDIPLTDDDQECRECCELLGVPIEISEAVQRNQKLLEMS